MDRITEAQLNQFTAEHGLASLEQSDRFEHFATYATIQNVYAETFDTNEVVLGGKEPGIDGVAIIVNSVLVTDMDEFTAVAASASALDVTFLFIQADRSPSFDGGKMGTFAFTVQDFFSDKPQLPRSARLNELAAVRAAIYAQAPKFKRSNPACHLYYITTGQWAGDPILDARRSTVVADLKSSSIFGIVEFECIGADTLQRLYRQTKNAIARDFNFPSNIAVPDLPGVKEAYFGFLPAKDFISIVTTADGEILRGIFDSNLRDFQNQASVNIAINETLKSGHKARFVLMNNGVTIIARVLQRTAYKFHIEDFQIVNGCQTSNVLCEYDGDLNGVVVPVRLICSDDDDVIQSIVTATNQQTQLSREQFFAATEFPKNLEQYLRAFDEPHQIFYERRSRQYDRLSVDKTRIISQANMIRAFAGMFLEEPHRTTRNFNALLDNVGREIFAEGHRLEPYYVAAYALLRLERLFKLQTIESKFKAARFQILLAFRRLANPAKVPNLNARALEKYCKVITDVLWDTPKADELLIKASEIIYKVTKGDLHRDNIRTSTVSDAIRTYSI